MGTRCGKFARTRSNGHARRSQRVGWKISISRALFTFKRTSINPVTRALLFNLRGEIIGINTAIINLPMGSALQFPPTWPSSDSAITDAGKGDMSWLASASNAHSGVGGASSGSTNMTGAGQRVFERTRLRSRHQTRRHLTRIDGIIDTKPLSRRGGIAPRLDGKS